jgi:flagellar biosynthesis/type III secretory pathway M-ring protein FliF/YscJ
VAMIPNQVLANQAAAAAAGGGGGAFGLIGGGGGLVGDSLLDTALLGGLALVSLTMMVMMVRRSSKKVDLPTAEELVGVPPVLESTDDLVGEAEEGEGALAGIEVGEDEVERNKMLDQIADLIQSEPQKAANLLGRWMAAGE